MVGPNIERGAKGRDRRVIVGDLELVRADIAPRVEPVRIGGDGATVRGQRLGRLVLGVQREAEIVPGFGEVAVKRDRRLEAADRVVKPSLRHTDQPQPVVMLQAAGGEPDGGREFDRRLVECAGPTQQLAQRSAHVRRLRIFRGRLAQQGDRGREFAPVRGDHPEQVERVEIRRLLGQHRAAESLGVAQPSGLVSCKSLLDPFTGRGGRGGTPSAAIMTVQITSLTRKTVVSR